MDAAKQLAADQVALTEEERALLAKSLDEIVKETPRMVLAVDRFRRLVAKAGPATAEAFRKILVDVLSEPVRKAIWG